MKAFQTFAIRCAEAPAIFAGMPIRVGDYRIPEIIAHCGPHPAWPGYEAIAWVRDANRLKAVYWDGEHWQFDPRASIEFATLCPQVRA